MTTTCTADGTEIAYDDTGGGSDGPTVVLVHGITESRESWAPIAERLSGQHRVVSLDLRGHGTSGTAARYDLEAMAGDVVAVIEASGTSRPRLVGHSLGGAVVSAVGALIPVSSVVNVDQSLQLGGFKAQLMEFESQLRDAAAFPMVISAIFDSMAGPLASTDEFARVSSLRRPDQTVVLGVWEMLLTMSEAEVDAVVDAALAGYASVDVPYLSLFGIDPGPGYSDWLAGQIAGATTEVWADHGHYPHLVDPDRFVDRLHAFWA
ncbi:MAG: alpha/beta hydrolase [Actinomycetota bacterium]